MSYYVIKGDPVPLSRARIGFGSRHMFDSQKEHKRQFAIHIQNQQGSDPILEGIPISLDVTFYLKMPRLSDKAKLAKRLQYHYYKPDLSNLIKFIEDVANKIILNDDCQISIITAYKVYHEQPRTEFSLQPIKHKYEEGAREYRRQPRP